MIAGLLATLPLDSSMSSDDGAYALQVHAVQQGAWSLTDPFQSLGLPDDTYAFVNSELSDRGRFPLPWSPIHVRLLQGSAWLFGTNLGLHIPSAVGALLAAVAAWLAAGELSARLSRSAFWLAGLSPVMVNSTTLWAHTLSAAGAGFAVWAALRIARNGCDWLAWAVLGLGLLVTVAVRSDGLAFAIALAGVLGASALFRRRIGVAVGAATTGSAALLLLVIQRRWSSSIVGGSLGVPEGRRHGTDWLDRRASGIWNGLFRGGWVDDWALTLGIAMCVLVVVAAWCAAARPRDGGRIIVAALVGVLVCMVVGRVVAPRDPVTGLFVAWPLVLVGLVARRWGGLAPRERLLAVTAAITAVGVVVTQHAGGAGMEWGGRYYSTLTVPVALLVAGGLQALREWLPGIRSIGMVLVAAAVIPAAAGLHMAYSVSMNHDRAISAVEATQPDVVVSAVPALPRIAWRTVPGISWIRADSSNLEFVLRTVTTSGPERVAVVGEQPPGIDGYSIEQHGGALWVLVRAD